MIEQPLETLAGEGEHVYVRLRKTGVNTSWLAAQIANFAGVKSRDVGYAGRKDRHAITEQWFSCYLPGGQGPNWDNLAVEDVELLEVRRHRRKLRTGDLAGNAFAITLRCVDGDPNPALERVARDGFPNYFGEQRFGLDGANLHRAQALLVEGARISHQRDMVMSAARGFLFNNQLSQLIELRGYDDLGSGEEGIMYGMSRDPQPLEASMPVACKGWIDGLRRLRVKTGSRALIARPTDMNWQVQDDVCRVNFTLPPGAYATSLLREVLRYREGKTAIEQGT